MTATAFERPRTARPGAMVGSLAFAGAAMSLMHTLVVPLLPALPDLLGTSITATSWVATATMIAGGVITPVAGRMGDMYGKRRVALASLALGVMGSVIASVAGSLPVLLVGRTLQGLALGVIPLALAILRDELAAERLSRGVAVTSAVMLGLGTGFGPLFMGVVLDAFGWHAVFWVATAMSALSLGLVARFVPESPVRTPARFDWVGAAGLSAVLVLLLLGITRGGDWGWSSPAIVGLLGASLVMGATWVRWEWGRAAPLVDLDVTIRRPVLITHAAGAMVGFAVFAQYIVAFTLVALSAETGHGFGRSMLVAGLTQVPGAVAMVGAAPVAARIVAARGARALLSIGSATVAAGFVLGLFWHGTLWQVALAAALIYAGVGLAYCALPLLVMAHVPVSETGAANAVNSLCRVIGSVVAAAVASAVLAASVVTIGDGQFPAHTGFVSIYLMGAVAAGAGCLLTRALPEPQVRLLVGDGLSAVHPDH